MKSSKFESFLNFKSHHEETSGSSRCSRNYSTLHSHSSGQIITESLPQKNALGEWCHKMDFNCKTSTVNKIKDDTTMSRYLQIISQSCKPMDEAKQISKHDLFTTLKNYNSCVELPLKYAIRTNQDLTRYNNFNKLDSRIVAFEKHKIKPLQEETFQLRIKYCDKQTDLSYVSSHFNYINSLEYELSECNNSVKRVDKSFDNTKSCYKILNDRFSGTKEYQNDLIKPYLPFEDYIFKYFNINLQNLVKTSKKEVIKMITIILNNILTDVKNIKIDVKDIDFSVTYLSRGLLNKKNENISSKELMLEIFKLDKLSNNSLQLLINENKYSYKTYALHWRQLNDKNKQLAVHISSQFKEIHSSIKILLGKINNVDLCKMSNNHRNNDNKLSTNINMILNKFGTSLSSNDVVTVVKNVIVSNVKRNKTYKVLLKKIEEFISNVEFKNGVNGHSSLEINEFLSHLNSKFVKLNELFEDMRECIKILELVEKDNIKLIVRDLGYHYVGGESVDVLVRRINKAIADEKILSNMLG